MGKGCAAKLVDVVICTFNNAAGLDEALGRLSAQHEPGFAWSVIVIDNASTDRTPEVARAWAARSGPAIRYVREPRRGLTPARLRAVRETDGEWIAFVDDDNLLDPDWLAAMGAAIRARTRAGAIGGRVSLLWDSPPPLSAHDFGFCFAEQELGEAAKPVESLVGAGMVVRRAALQASGWAEGPLLPDRVGKSLISGGDVEIALRVKAARYELWYEPAARLQHRQRAARATRRYLLRMNRALGVTAAAVSLLGWPGDFEGWRRTQQSVAADRMAQAWRGLAWSLRTQRRITAALGWLSFAWGLRAGVAAVARLPHAARAALMGKAALCEAESSDIAPAPTVSRRSLSSGRPLAGSGGRDPPPPLRSGGSAGMLRP
jgi:glycosyltransferase involved in cell wall biosynthesis